MATEKQFLGQEERDASKAFHRILDEEDEARIAALDDEEEEGDEDMDEEDDEDIDESVIAALSKSLKELPPEIWEGFDDDDEDEETEEVNETDWDIDDLDESDKELSEALEATPYANPYKKRKPNTDDGSRTYTRSGMPKYAIVDFFVESQKRRVLPNTQNAMLEKLNRVLSVFESEYGVVVEKERIVGLTGAVIQTWCNKTSVDHAPRTMNLYISFMNRFFGWAYSMGYMTENYQGLLKMQKVPDKDSYPEEKRIEKYYDHNQVRSLFELIEEEKRPNWLRDRAIAALILYSGLRQEEIEKLKIKQLYSHGRGKIYCQRKGGAWKMVTVGEAAYRYIEPYLDTRVPYDEEEPLFIGRPDSKTPLCGDRMYNSLKYYQDKLGLPSGTHVLRHVFVSEVEKTGGVAVARDCANHKHLRVTDLYDHTSEAQRKRAVDKIDYFADDTDSREHYGLPTETIDPDCRKYINGICAALTFGNESDRQGLKEKLSSLYQIYVEIPGLV